MWYFILGLVLTIYVLINIILTNIFIGIVETFVMKPLLFINFAICVFFIENNEDENGIYFRTKGNGNEDPDYFPVYEDYILGKSVFHLPKIVWFQIIVREFFNILSKPRTS